MTTSSRIIATLVLCLAGLVGPPQAFGRPIGGQFPQQSVCACKACNSCTESAACGCALSNSEGDIRDRYRGAITVKSGFGPTLDFVLTYNSMAADGSQSRTNTGMGYGWTHSYNILLLSQFGHMFRMDGEGRVTKYKLGAGGTYTATTGYFETLVKNPDGSFTLGQKDGTTYDFALVPGTPFFIVGPVYRLLRITDRNGNVTALTYLAGKLVAITDTYGRQLTLAYTGNSLAAVMDPLGRVTQFAYDANGTLLSKITDPEGDTAQYTYNALAQITQKVDKDGRVFTYQYNSAQKPVAVVDGTGAPLLTLSNPNNWATDEAALAIDQMRIYVPSITTKIDGRGNAWRYTYDNHGYLTQVVAPDGATTRYTYDPGTLRVATETDANNHTTSYQYDSQGNVIRKTDAAGNVTTFTYEPSFNMLTSMTDANGRITRYQYDSRGNRIGEIDPLGGTRSWNYDSHGNVLTEADKNGNVTRYQYDAFGDRTRITDAVGNVTQMTYDAVGNMTARINPRGFTTNYHYDGLNRVVQEIDALGHVTETIYDGQGNRIELIDRDGNATRDAYDQRQRLIHIVDALGQITRYTYDGNDNRVSSTDKNGHTTMFQYDVQNRLNRIVDALGNVSTTTYDAVGNRIAATDANAHTTSYQYDALNRIVRRTDAEGNVTQLVYDMVGLAGCPQCTGPTRGSSAITEQIDAEGKVTYFKYDGLDRPIIEIRKQTDTADSIDADDAVTRYSYDAQSNRVAIVEPNGNTTSYVYDALNRQVRMTNAAGDAIVTSYDQNSNVKTVTAPNLNVTTNTYDALDRLIQVDDSVGRVANYTYDAVGNRLTEKDGNGHGSAYTYDAIYRVTDVTDALGRSVHFAYDAVGNLLNATDREGNVTAYQYDAINRRTRTTDALGDVTQAQYDAVGNLTRLIDANNHATDYNYDGINRPIKETYADGRTRTFTYDHVSNLKTRTDQKGQVTTYTYSDLYFLVQRSYPVSPTDNMSYDLSGRMLNAERGGWNVTFSYDGANRVTQTTQNGKVVSYAYNIPGRTRSLAYPGGRSIVEHTDLRSRLGTIDDVGSPPPIVEYQYDLGDRVLMRSYRNGTTASYGYNANDWVTSLEHSKGVIRVAGFAYDFDRQGNKRFEQKLADTASSNTRSEAYQYDNIYRLIDYKVGSLVGSTVPVPTTQTQYTLDPLGNWNVKTKDGTPETRLHDATNAITQIGAVPVFSDPNGNTSEDGLYRYAYDEENRLTAVTRKSDSRLVGQYQYDALSRRIKKVAAGTPSSPIETRYFYDDARLVEEQTPGGATLATYIYGNYVDEVLTMNRGATTYYYHQNSLWSVEAVTDAAGNVVERYAYDAYALPSILDAAGNLLPPNAWGTPHSAIGNPWMFTGRQFDEETGLYFHRARYYDAVKGRFLQRDPAGYVDGLNLYAYTNDRPTFSADPSGLTTIWTKIRFWYNASGGNGGIGNPYYLGVGYPVGRVDISQEIACTQDAGYSRGGMAIANTAGEYPRWEYGTVGTYSVTKKAITCGPDILDNSYPGVNVTIEANVSYTKGALWKHVVKRVAPSAATSALSAAIFGFGPQSLAGPILMGGVGFYEWVYDFESFNAGASISYDVCCQCCADGSFKPAVYPRSKSISLRTNINQLALAMSQEQLTGCSGGKKTSLYMRNAFSADAKKALANREWDARVTPGFGFQEVTQ